MKTFYFQLGERLGGLAGFRMAILSGNPAFEAAFHHRPLRRRPLWNGPIECTLLEYAPRAGRTPGDAPLRHGGSGSPAPRPSDPGLAPTEKPADVSPVRPEHRREEHRDQPRRGDGSPGDEPGDRDRDEPGEQ